MTPPLRAALYSRVSTENQAKEGVSLAAQQEAMVAYCKSQGWQVAEVYVDDGYSGKNLRRPAVKRLIADTEAKRFDVILVYRLDRLSRRQWDVLGLLENIFEPSGVGFRSTTEPFDTTNPAGKAMLAMLAVFAQLERETIIERTKMGMRQAAKEGRWHGGTRITYGYTLENNRLTPDPVTAPVVRRIFGLYTREHLGYESIAARLNAEGVPPPRPNKYGWTTSTVRYILRNPHYAGLGIHGVLGGREIFAGHHEALVPEDDHRHAGEIMQGRRDYQGPKRQSLLSGILYCSECGGKMRSKRQWVNWPRTPKRYFSHYVCYNYLGEPAHLVTGTCTAAYRRGPDVDARVLEWISGLAFSTEALDLALAEAAVDSDSEAERAGDEKTGLLRALEDTGRKLRRWYDAFESGALDASGLRDRVAALHTEESRLKDRLATVERTIAEFGGRRQAGEDLRDRLSRLAELLPTMSPEDQWATIHEAIAGVWVDRNGDLVDVKTRL